jgi:hypothetical protein
MLLECRNVSGGGRTQRIDNSGRYYEGNQGSEKTVTKQMRDQSLLTSPSM